MVRLYLVRHGETVDAGSGLITGQRDIDLSPEGKNQVEHLAMKLREVYLDGIYGSDLIRSIKSAEAIASGRRLKPAFFRELREIGFGRWEGLSFRDVMESYPGALEERAHDLVHFCPPGGESIKGLRERVIHKLRELLDRHSDGAICIAGHGAVNRVILIDALGMDLRNFYRIEQDFGCLNIVDYFPDGGIVVRLINGK
ncbi:MAG: histidine phosphatase family protein [Candidatus Bathyarchaeia archaeon]